jgi:outer membrane lipoprotein-sorting protein
MQLKLFFKAMKTGLFFLFILFFGWCSVYAAEFTADLIVTSPESVIVYDLKVKGNMYRIKKVKGPVSFPSLPVIYNRATGISWGLNPQVNQYVEQTDPVKTMMMNPVAGWEFMRRKLKPTPVGTKSIQGYSCHIFEYRQQGDTRVSNRVWVSYELGFTMKEISYALNGDATLTLKNIKKGPVDPALFKIPSGYTKVKVPAKAGEKAAGPSQAVTKAVKGEAPWGRRIKAGGEIQVKVDPQRPVKIIFFNRNKTASICAYTTFRQGDAQTPVKTGHISMTRKGQRKEVTIKKNSKIEWVFIRVDEGLIYTSIVNEKDPFSFDRYKLQEGYLTVKEGAGLSVKFTRKLIVTITGDSQDSLNSEISLICYQQQYTDKVFEKKVQIVNKETKIWEFLPDQKIQTCEIKVLKTGGVKYRVEQPELVK